jgi:hypothetical protein
MKYSTSVSVFIVRGGYPLAIYTMTLTPVNYILAMRQVCARATRLEEA